MNKSIIKLIADTLGVHTSTVYRILQGSGSYSSDLIAKVRSMASELGYTHNHKKNDSSVRIGVAIPSAPSKFWKSAMSGIEHAAAKIGATVYTVNYAYGSDRNSQLYALKHLKEYDCTGYIVYPFNDSIFEKEIYDILPENRILFFETPPKNIRNSCMYIGPDHYQEGQSAAKLAREYQKAMIVFNSKDGIPISTTKRGEGFRSTFLSIQGNEIVMVHIDATDKLASSKLAAQIDQHKPDCVYATGGFSNVVCLACAKVQRITDCKIKCICHDILPNKYVALGIILGSITHDPYRQGEQAVMRIAALNV